MGRKGYSADLRNAAVHLHNKGYVLREIADLLNVSKSSVQRWVVSTNSIIQSSPVCVCVCQSSPVNNENNKIDTFENNKIVAFISSQIQSNPFSTTLSISQTLKTNNFHVSREYVRKVIHKLGFSYKKRVTLEFQKMVNI